MKILIIVLAIVVILAGSVGIYFAIQKISPAPATELLLLTEDYPPITYAGADGQITGLATEVVREIMKRLGVDYQIRLMKWDDAYGQALHLPNVVLFSTERTAAREDYFNWVGPVGSNSTYFYAPQDSKLKINSLDDAKNVAKIATCSSWFTEQYLRDQGFNNLQSYSDPKDDVRQLIDKKADLSVFTDMTVGNLVESAGYSPEEIKPLYRLMETQFYIAISRGTSADIVAKWQGAFEQIKADGTLAAIYKKYVPDIAVPN